jgi:hypothetical protein
MDSVEYEQACISLRHYSNLRYAILTVFITINGVLIGFVYGKDAPISRADIALSLQWFGLLSAFAFGWIEYTINGYLKAFGKFVEARRLFSHWSRRPQWGRKLVSFATIFPHFFLAFFWAYSLLMLPKSQSLDLVGSVDAAFHAIPSISRTVDGVWNVESLLWNEAAQSLDLVLLDQASSQRWAMAMDASSGKIARAFKLAPVVAVRPAPTGTRTAQIQARLLERGYPVGQVDGIVGRKTIRALQLFQKAEGLPASGEITIETAARLESRTAAP